MSNFVILTKQEFEEQCLPMGWKIVDDDRAKEIIYQFPTENKKLFVRIYSTVDKRSGVTRDIGTDAIRIVFWANNRAVGKGKRIHRVEGRTTIGSRIRARIQEFLADAKNQNIVDMNYVRAILEHDAVNWMEFARSLLEQLDERGSLSDYQIQYIIGEKNPKGKPTFEARVREQDPDFEYSEYDDEYEEESSAVEKKEYVGTEESISDSPDLFPPPIACRGEEENPAVIEDEVERPIGLVPTSEYKDFQYPFPFFNPVQSAVFPVRDEDVNIIISANTSSGKTICAELIMDVILRRRKQNK